MTKTFLIKAKVSGKTHHLTNGYENGVVTSHYFGNKRSTEKSAINGFNKIMKIYGCKVDVILSISEID